jgi:hypothetical protein
MTAFGSAESDLGGISVRALNRVLEKIASFKGAAFLAIAPARLLLRDLADNMLELFLPRLDDGLHLAALEANSSGRTTSGALPHHQISRSLDLAQTRSPRLRP